MLFAPCCATDRAHRAARESSWCPRTPLIVNFIGRGREVGLTAVYDPRDRGERIGIFTGLDFPQPLLHRFADELGQRDTQTHGSTLQLICELLRKSDLEFHAHS